MIKVAFADDHNLFLDGIGALLDKQPDIEVVNKASNGEDLIHFLKEGESEIVILDVNMPGIDGVGCAKWILNNKPDIKIIMLTMIDKLVMIDKLMELGVHAYLLKNVREDELVSAIKTVRSGKKYFSPEITEKIFQLNQERKNKTFALTKREKEVLQLIAEGYKTTEIAERLYLSKHTIDTHRKNLLSKAGVKNAVDLVNWARLKEIIL